MVEDIKKLTLKPQLHMLGQGKPFCQVEVTPEEIGTAQGIAAEISEPAILRAVAAIADAAGTFWPLIICSLGSTARRTHPD